MTRMRKTCIHSPFCYYRRGGNYLLEQESAYPSTETGWELSFFLFWIQWDTGYWGGDHLIKPILLTYVWLGGSIFDRFLMVLTCTSFV